LILDTRYLILDAGCKMQDTFNGAASDLTFIHLTREHAPFLEVTPTSCYASSWR